jgi:non-specific serine/threonine protein kinase/serine/threonine-protein kinase
LGILAVAWSYRASAIASREPATRNVALKIIKLAMDTEQVIARFEAERQALALMCHPNIACMLDGGATESGRPYFVMELMHGIPITEFCHRNKPRWPAGCQRQW